MNTVKMPKIVKLNKRKSISFGVYPAITLSEARKKN